jgi:hypothetical protein
MRKQHKPRASKRQPAADFDPSVPIARLYDDLVEVEALAVTADEAATMLPPTPSAKRKRILARLTTLVSKTCSKACAALERVEELVALHAAHLAARKRSPVGRADGRAPPRQPASWARRSTGSASPAGGTSARRVRA